MLVCMLMPLFLAAAAGTLSSRKDGRFGGPPVVDLGVPAVELGPEDVPDPALVLLAAVPLVRPGSCKNPGSFSQ